MPDSQNLAAAPDRILRNRRDSFLPKRYQRVQELLRRCSAASEEAWMLEVINYHFFGYTHA